MTEIVLVRHAPTAWSGRRYCGRTDPPLDQRGRSVAGRVAVDLRTRLPSDARLISSPRRRAVATATRVSAAMGGGPIEIDERWAETDFGIAEGLTFDELAAAAPDLAARLLAGEVDIDWPAGEPAATLAARIEEVWNELANRDPGTVVVVTHGGPIRLTVGLATGTQTATVVAPPPGGIVRLVRAGPGDSWSVAETP